MITLDTNEETRIQAFEYMRSLERNTEVAIEFADFAVGFPTTMPMSDIYVSYLAAKHGPEAISMKTQEFTT